VSSDGREFQARARRVEALVERLEACPDPAAREAARELVRALLELHAAGLARVLELTAAAGEPGRALGERFARDGVIGTLLLLHDLHPEAVEGRVAGALDRLRPRLRAQRGDAELLGATGEQVRVRLRGDASAAAGLRSLVEEALLAAAPDVLTVVFEEAWDSAPPGRVPLPLLAAGARVAGTVPNDPATGTEGDRHG
jgi:hypothetical protein